MWVRMATAPGSWGVEPPGDPTDPPWETVLDEIAAAGFSGVELGPIGYLPEQPAGLRMALAARGLELAGGYVMEPFHRLASRRDVLSKAQRTFRALAGGGASVVVLIEALEPHRAASAGRTTAAPRLDAHHWSVLLDTLHEVARLAVDEFGLDPAFHPHAGTNVEFADEVDRLLAATDPSLIGLCLDTGHATYAGADPTDLLLEHGDRIRHVHLKDVQLDVLERARTNELTFQQAVADGVFCPLGAGVVDFGSVRGALEAIGYQGWATFEQDRLVGDPRASVDAASSLAHAREIGIAAQPAASERSAR